MEGRGGHGFEVISTECPSHTPFSLSLVSDIVKLALSNHQGVAIKFVSNISKANPLIPCYTSATLNVVAKDLVKHHAHRVVVMEELKGGTEGDNKFVGVLSQSALAAFVVREFGIDGKLDPDLTQIH